jgi:hypothetical protein
MRKIAVLIVILIIGGVVMGEPNFFSFTGGVPLANGRIAGAPFEALFFGYSTTDELIMASFGKFKTAISGHTATTNPSSGRFLPDGLNNSTQEKLYLSSTNDGGKVVELNLNTLKSTTYNISVTNCDKIIQEPNGYVFYPKSPSFPSQNPILSTGYIQMNLNVVNEEFETLAVYDTSGYINATAGNNYDLLPTSGYTEPNILEGRLSSSLTTEVRLIKNGTTAYTFSAIVKIRHSTGEVYIDVYNTTTEAWEELLIGTITNGLDLNINTNLSVEVKFYWQDYPYSDGWISMGSDSTQGLDMDWTKPDSGTITVERAKFIYDGNLEIFDTGAFANNFEFVKDDILSIEADFVNFFSQTSYVFREPWETTPEEVVLPEAKRFNFIDNSIETLPSSCSFGVVFEELTVNATSQKFPVKTAFSTGKMSTSEFSYQIGDLFLAIYNVEYSSFPNSNRFLNNDIDDWDCKYAEYSMKNKVFFPQSESDHLCYPLKSYFFGTVAMPYTFLDNFSKINNDWCYFNFNQFTDKEVFYNLETGTSVDLPECWLAYIMPDKLIGIDYSNNMHIFNGTSKESHNVIWGSSYKILVTSSSMYMFKNDTLLQLKDGNISYIQLYNKPYNLESKDILFVLENINGLIYAYYKATPSGTSDVDIYRVEIDFLNGTATNTKLIKSFDNESFYNVYVGQFI